MLESLPHATRKHVQSTCPSQCWPRRAAQQRPPTFCVSWSLPRTRRAGRWRAWHMQSAWRGTQVHSGGLAGSDGFMRGRGMACWRPPHGMAACPAQQRLASVAHAFLPARPDAVVVQALWGGCCCPRAASSRWTSKVGDPALYLLSGQRGRTASHQVSRRALVHQAALDVQVPLLTFLATPHLLPSLTIASIPGILYETEAVPMPCTLALVQTKHGGSELVRGCGRFAAHSVLCVLLVDMHQHRASACAKPCSTRPGANTWPLLSSWHTTITFRTRPAPCLQLPATAM